MSGFYHFDLCSALDDLRLFKNRSSYQSTCIDVLIDLLLQWQAVISFRRLSTLEIMYVSYFYFSEFIPLAIGSSKVHA